MTEINSATDLASALGGGKVIGREHVVKCPGHDDSNPSLYISDGEKGIVFYCQSNCTQEHLLSVFKERGFKFKFAGKNGLPLTPQGVPFVWPPSSVLKKQGLEPSAENQKRLVKFWTYRSADKKIIGFVARYEGHEKKDTIPFFNQFPNGGWKSGHASKTNRPLYGLAVLAEFPDALVLVVEGEKCAAIVNRLNPEKTGIVAVSWPGGAKVVGKADWKPLTNRRVLVWPDWDRPGLEAAVDVAELCPGARFINPPALSLSAIEEGWDVADYLTPTTELAFTASLLESVAVASIVPDEHFERPVRKKNVSQNTVLSANEPDALPGSGNFAHTDLGNAERFIDRHGANLRYTSEGGWMMWDGKRWAQDEFNQIYNMAGFVCREISMEASASKEEKEYARVMRFAQSSGNLPKIEALTKLARSLPGISLPYTSFDEKSWLLNCQNGVVDLRSGSLEPHDKSMMLSKIISTKFDAGASCPLWINFLRQTLKKDSDKETEELISYVRRAVGYSLTGSTQEQCAFFLWGDGSNGKSVFVETLRKLAGGYAMSTDTNLILLNEHGGDSSSNSVARLKSIRMVVGSELPPFSRLNEAKVKEMTGQDTMSARFLYKEFFDFLPQFKLWIRCNNRPEIRGTDHGIWRRIHCIPFTNPIFEDEKDKNLLSKLAEELPGILTWAVTGAIDWYQSSLSMPRSVEDAIRIYRADMDLLGDFLEDRCVTEETAAVASHHLFASYLEWAKTQNERPITQRRLGLSLRGRGFKRVKRQDGRYYLGLRLKADVISTATSAGESFGEQEDMFL